MVVTEVKSEILEVKILLILSIEILITEPTYTAQKIKGILFDQFNVILWK